MQTLGTGPSSSEPSKPTRESSDCASSGVEPVTQGRWPLSPTGRPVIGVPRAIETTTPADLGLTDPDLLMEFDRVRRIFKMLGTVNGLRLARAVALTGRVSGAQLAQQMPDCPHAAKAMLTRMEELGLIRLLVGAHWDVTLIEPTALLLWVLPAGVLGPSKPTGGESRQTIEPEAAAGT